MMLLTIEQHLKSADRLIGNGLMADAQTHSLQAIARLMVQVLAWADQAMTVISSTTAPGAVVELTAEPCCQCKAEPNALAAAAPELLRLIQDAMASAASAYCPWCHEYFEDGHYPGCPGVEILKRFEDR